MNDLTPQKSLTRQEQLEQEIDDLKKSFEAEVNNEAKARTAQHWIKKRIKIAKDELTEVSNA